MKKLRIVYFGTPAFALPSLEALHNDSRFDVCAVVTKEPQPVGRSKIPMLSPVGLFAEKNHIPLHTPTKIRTLEFIETLSAYGADFFVVLAYGKIFPPSILSLPLKGCINVHGSLLPLYRGASPVQAALMHGDTSTGITIMTMGEGMDTGAMLAQHSCPIETYETTPTLMNKLAELSKTHLPDTLVAFEEGHIAPQAQDDTQATYTTMLSKEDGHMDPLHHSAEEILWQWRGVTPWPALTCILDKKYTKLLDIRLSDQNVPAGNCTVTKHGLFIGTKNGSLSILRIQPEGKPPMDIVSYIAGLHGSTPVLTNT